MPSVTNGEVDLYYEVDGSGETVAFVGDAGYGAWQWAFLHPQIAGPLEALVWDHRGTGRSDAPPGPYDVETLASDLEAVLAAHGTRRVHLAGAGLGGLVAVHYAREFGRAATLALFATPPDGAAVEADALRALGPRPETDADCLTSLQGALTPAFRDTHPDLVDRICAWRRDEDANSDAFAAQVEALLEAEPGPLYEVDVPALVFGGVDDPVVPAAASEALADRLPRAEYVPVDSRHLPQVQAASAVADRWLALLADRGDVQM